MFKVKEGLLIGGKSVTGTGPTEVLTAADVGTMAYQNADSFTATTVTAGGFRLDDQDSSYYLTLQSLSNLGAGSPGDKTLTFDVNSAARTIDLNGNLSIGGSLTTSHAFTTTTNAITLNANASGSNVTLPTGGLLYSSLANSITSASLLNAMSDETGTGALVFASSPTITSLVVNSGLTVGTGGLTVSASGANITGASTIEGTLRVGGAFNAANSTSTVYYNVAGKDLYSIRSATEGIIFLGGDGSKYLSYNTGNTGLYNLPGAGLSVGGTVTATLFSGNATSASAVTVNTVADNIEYTIVMNSGSNLYRDSDSSLKYNPSSNILYSPAITFNNTTGGAMPLQQTSTSYQHLGQWGQSGTSAGTFLVNRAYRSDRCDGNSNSSTYAASTYVATANGNSSYPIIFSSTGTNGGYSALNVAAGANANYNPSTSRLSIPHYYAYGSGPTIALSDSASTHSGVLHHTNASGGLFFGAGTGTTGTTWASYIYTATPTKPYTTFLTSVGTDCEGEYSVNGCSLQAGEGASSTPLVVVWNTANKKQYRLNYGGDNATYYINFDWTYCAPGVYHMVVICPYGAPNYFNASISWGYGTPALTRWLGRSEAPPLRCGGEADPTYGKTIFTFLYTGDIAYCFGAGAKSGTSSS